MKIKKIQEKIVNQLVLAIRIILFELQISFPLGYINNYNSCMNEYVSVELTHKINHRTNQ